MQTTPIATAVPHFQERDSRAFAYQFQHPRRRLRFPPTERRAGPGLAAEAKTRLDVTYRDLAADAVAHFSALTLAPAPAELRDAALKHEVAVGEEVLEEFLAADVVVIGAPMYNFTISSQLKAWIDRIAVAGKTFRYTENSPVGLAGDKKVVIVSTAGGVACRTSRPARPTKATCTVLGFFGIHRYQVVRAEAGLWRGPRAQAIAAARRQIAGQFAAA
ncbi:NAD(P)H-dependent oxidoreductase [Pseudomonas aeruginosa]